MSSHGFLIKFLVNKNKIHGIFEWLILSRSQWTLDVDHVIFNTHRSVQSDQSRTYLSYRIENLITPHYWSCSSELCIWILLHDFDQSDSVFWTQCNINGQFPKHIQSHLIGQYDKNWTQSVMGSYQILNVISKVEVWL